MAQSANIVWEVRNGGSSTNGGGFKVGATGTDWSQQTSPQYSVTDGVTAGSTTITSATANFGTDVVGNVIYVQGGTGSVAADRYEITARASATSITVDRATGLTAGTGVTLKIGGCLDAIGTLKLAMQTNGQWAFMKKGTTYAMTTTSAFTLNNTPNNTTPWNRIIGYDAVRGDNGRPVIQLSTNSNLRGFECSGGGWSIENFDIDCNSLSGSRGVSHGGNYSRVFNCKVSNYRDYGIVAGVNFNMTLGCEVTGGTTGATAGILQNFGNGSIVAGNWIHDCTVGHGISIPGSGSVRNNLITNITSTSASAILCGYQGNEVSNNTIYAAGLWGIFLNNTSDIGYLVRHNLIANCLHASGGAIKFNSTGAVAKAPFNDGNAFYNNTTNRTFGDSASGIAALATGNYVNALDVLITAGSPFVNAAGNDFRLNGIPSQGVLCRGTARGLVAMPGLTLTDYLDFGALQAPPSGSRSRLVNA